MAHRFECPTCNQWHEGWPDMGYPEPDHTAGIPEPERGSRVYFTSDLCVLDETHFFIRCLLVLPVQGAAEDFAFGVWSTLSKENFQRYHRQHDEDMSGWEPVFGYLSNRLPGYPDTMSLHLSVQTGGIGKRPTVMVQSDDHPLAHDQRCGLSMDRLLEIIAPYLTHRRPVSWA